MQHGGVLLHEYSNKKMIPIAHFTAHFQFRAMVLWITRTLEKNIRGKIAPGD